VPITWNPADKAAGIVLSNGDLNAGNTIASWAAARAAASASTGKRYFELEVMAGGAGTIEVGLGTSAATLVDFVGKDIYGYAFRSNATRWNNNAFASYGLAYVQGNVVGVCMDFDTGELSFYLNGLPHGVAYSGLSGTFYPMISLYGTTPVVRGRFNNGDFVCGPPSSGWFTWDGDAIPDPLYTAWNPYET